MTDLLLRRLKEARRGAEGRNDYDVVGPYGLGIGRIFKAITAPAGMPWIWSLAYGYHERARAAMTALAESWRCE